MNRDESLAVVDELYAAATGETDWPGALARLADGLGSESATLEIHDTRKARLVHIESARLDLDRLRRYGHEFAWSNPRMDFMRHCTAEQVGFDHLFMTEREIDRDPFYQELLAPDGLRYFLSAQSPLPGRHSFILLSLQRSGRVRGIEEEHVALMERLRPHIVRALRLHWSRLDARIDTDWLDRALAAHGLTPAERRLAAALLLGEALPAYARRTDRSINTVYTHYCRIKAKLDCATQPEILARLHALIAAMPAHADTTGTIGRT